MFKNIKNENVLCNILQNRGNKHKSEKILKGALKETQKHNKKKQSLDLLRRSLLLSAESVGVVKQTIKRGKRKRVVKKTLLLVSEKARFSKACKNFTSRPHQAAEAGCKTCAEKLALRIQNINEYTGFTAITSISSLDRKASVKFRW